MVKHSGPEPQENLLKEWESQPLLASIAKYTPNIAERPLTATKQVFGCWLSITQPTPCCKRRNHSLPTLKKPFPYKVHGSFFMSPVFLFLFLPFPLGTALFLFHVIHFLTTKKMAAEKNPGFFSDFLSFCSSRKGTDFKNMAQGLELAIDLHIHEVFSKVGLPEQTTKKIRFKQPWKMNGTWNLRMDFNGSSENHLNQIIMASGSIRESNRGVLLNPAKLLLYGSASGPSKWWALPKKKDLRAWKVTIFGMTILDFLGCKYPPGNEGKHIPAAAKRKIIDSKVPFKKGGIC